MQCYYRLMFERIKEIYANYFKDDTAVAQSTPGSMLSQDGTYGVLHSCIDSRLDHHHFKPGQLLRSRVAGAIILPWAQASPEIKASLGYPLTGLGDNKTIIIEGHTHCGAVGALLDSLLNNTDNDMAKWMLPIASNELKEALNGNHKNEENLEEPLKRQLEQYTVLQSMHNLLDYQFNGQKVTDLMKKNGLHVVGAIRDIPNYTEGKQGLQFFDPDAGEFIAAEKLDKNITDQPIKAAQIDAGISKVINKINEITHQGTATNGTTISLA
jgi:carbonic anhydrase